MGGLYCCMQTGKSLSRWQGFFPCHCCPEKPDADAHSWDAATAGHFLSLSLTAGLIVGVITDNCGSSMRSIDGRACEVELRDENGPLCRPSASASAKRNKRPFFPCPACQPCLPHQTTLLSLRALNGPTWRARFIIPPATNRIWNQHVNAFYRKKLISTLFWSFWSSYHTFKLTSCLTWH